MNSDKELIERFRVHIVQSGYDDHGEQRCTQCGKVISRREPSGPPVQGGFPTGRVLEVGDVSTGKDYSLTSLETAWDKIHACDGPDWGYEE